MLSRISLVVFVAAFSLTTGNRPVMAQSSTLLGTVERWALTMEAEQDETFIQRRRSGTLATVGGVVAAAGLVMALQPPKCRLEGPTSESDREPWANTWFNWSATFGASLKDGQCDIQVVYERTWDNGSRWGTVGYESDQALIPESARFYVYDQTVETNRILNYVGWAAVGAGGALLWYGLRQVEVPFRLDVTPGGGLRVTRSVGW